MGILITPIKYILIVHVHPVEYIIVYYFIINIMYIGSIRKKVNNEQGILAKLSKYLKL